MFWRAELAGEYDSKSYGCMSMNNHVYDDTFEYPGTCYCQLASFATMIVA